MSLQECTHVHVHTHRNTNAGCNSKRGEAGQSPDVNKIKSMNREQKPESEHQDRVKGRKQRNKRGKRERHKRSAGIKLNVAYEK